MHPLTKFLLSLTIASSTMYSGDIQSTDMPNIVLMQEIRENENVTADTELSNNSRASRLIDVTSDDSNELDDSSDKLKDDINIATDDEIIIFTSSAAESIEYQGTEGEEEELTDFHSCAGILATVPAGNAFKSYMSYQAITSTSSPQYKLGLKATTGKYGIRIVDGRYLVAVGTGYTSEVGTYIDIEMQNGAVLQCIVGDIKANIHTDDTNRQQKYDGSVVEFIVDCDKLPYRVKAKGDISYANSDFKGEIESITIYQ